MELEQLRSDMIAAMKQKDKGRKEAISALVAAVKKVGIDEGCREDIPTEIVDRVILKELKTVKEQIDSCPGEREDLLEQYRFTYEVISEYAPQMMTAEEVKTILMDQFSEVIATKNKGAIMKAVMVELKGKADGKVINQVVAELTQ
ncbi:MAG: GatB/YqeY domain-containing protein [Eubacteriales bacterium]